MKTITKVITLYEFGELCEAAQCQAVEEIASKRVDYPGDPRNEKPLYDRAISVTGEYYFLSSGRIYSEKWYVERFHK
jgi:hypothetical protein